MTVEYVSISPAPSHSFWKHLMSLYIDKPLRKRSKETFDDKLKLYLRELVSLSLIEPVQF